MNPLTPKPRVHRPQARSDPDAAIGAEQHPPPIIDYRLPVTDHILVFVH